MIVLVVVASLCLAACGHGQLVEEEVPIASECPVPNGFFADAVQCDKYYQCRNNILTEKLCPDGMVFNDGNHRVEKCDFPFHVSCIGRPKLQTPNPVKNCPRQNGYFAHPTPSVCDVFFYCHGGTAAKNTCPETLVFSLKTGTCVWPDGAGRENCVAEKLHNFTCPVVDDAVGRGHPRYSDPEDCQYFYVCINGKEPRRNGCGFGTIFNAEKALCDSPTRVPECADFYTGYFDEYFATLEVSGGTPQNDIIKAALAAGYPVPDSSPIHITKSGAIRRRKLPAERTQTLDNAVEFSGAQNIAPPSIPSRIPISISTAGKRRKKPASLAQRPVRRRRPSARKTTTTTTTTQAPAEDDYIYYDYYEDGTRVPDEGQLISVT